MLADGLDCTASNPPERFDTSYFYHPTAKMPGKFYAQGGGYLSTETVFNFDRQFFRIPPAEADHLDPQVRLLLEVTWEALEDSGLPPESLRGSDTGVYVGVTSNEYFKFVNEPAENLNAYSNSGTNSCMVSNRISYEFDFRGPSYSIDTACSSSLYAIHQASEALRRGDCDMAVAGGVNAVLLPTTTIAFCQAQMLSPDGKCKSFDARADGYARSEGAGMIVLKPLVQALKDNDPIYALVRGGALSNDGKTQGIAQPGYDAQVALIDRAYRHAAIRPSQVQYIEAHGTGTKAGDRTEANAIGQAAGRSRGPDQPPLYIGSVKSNIGHTEGAAGVAGVMKVAMMLAMQQIPPVVHFETPNPEVNFTALNLRVPTSLTSWPSHTGHAMASCSSFGFGGANAHIVLQESPVARQIRGSLAIGSATQFDHAESGEPEMSAKLLLLSAASANALQQHVRNWITFLETIPSDNTALFADILYSAAMRSQHHAYRLAAVIYTPKDAIERLNDYLNGTKSDNVTSGVVGETDANNTLVFAFSGMGTQWWAMGRKLSCAKFTEVFIHILRVVSRSPLSTFWSSVVIDGCSEIFGRNKYCRQHKLATNACKRSIRYDLNF
jgi:acyl transferase domain-containing protein